MFSFIYPELKVLIETSIAVLTSSLHDPWVNISIATPCSDFGHELYSSMLDHANAGAQNIDQKEQGVTRRHVHTQNGLWVILPTCYEIFGLAWLWKTKSVCICDWKAVLVYSKSIDIEDYIKTVALVRKRYNFRSLDPHPQKNSGMHAGESYSTAVQIIIMRGFNDFVRKQLGSEAMGGKFRAYLDICAAQCWYSSICCAFMCGVLNGLDQLLALRCEWLALMSTLSRKQFVIWVYA